MNFLKCFIYVYTHIIIEVCFIHFIFGSLDINIEKLLIKKVKRRCLDPRVSPNATKAFVDDVIVVLRKSLPEACMMINIPGYRSRVIKLDNGIINHLGKFNLDRNNLTVESDEDVSKLIIMNLKFNNVLIEYLVYPSKRYFTKHGKDPGSLGVVRVTMSQIILRVIINACQFDRYGCCKPGLVNCTMTVNNKDISTAYKLFRSQNNTFSIRLYRHIEKTVKLIALKNTPKVKTGVNKFTEKVIKKILRQYGYYGSLQQKYHPFNWNISAGYGGNGSMNINKYILKRILYLVQVPILTYDEKDFRQLKHLVGSIMSTKGRRRRISRSTHKSTTFRIKRSYSYMSRKNVSKRFTKRKRTVETFPNEWFR